MRRDPFLDVIRVGAILLVVGQHWLMPVLSATGDTLTTGNALTTPGWWLLTWLSQVMPVVFFAGGAANAHSYRTAAGPREWLAGRLGRLVLPVLPLAAVWVGLPNTMLALGFPAQPVDLAGGITAQLLWFLVVYLAVVLLTPLMVKAHGRFGAWTLLPLAAGAVLVDAVRFAGLTEAGYLNAVLVWLAVHQLGICYANGLFEFGSRLGYWALAAAGFGTTALMVACGPYAPSMIGMPGAPVSNMSPPAAVLLPLALGQLGLLLLARPWLSRLDGPTARALGARSTTVYLWHMPALVVVAGVAVLGFGYRTPDPGSVAWFAAAPVWLGCATLVLTGLVNVFGRAETLRLGGVPAGSRVVTGTVITALGLLGLTVRGFSPDGPGLFDGPVPWAAMVVAGLVVGLWDDREWAARYGRATHFRLIRLPALPRPLVPAPRRARPARR
ncbi:acyltransferase [Actinokineospora sp. NBRC 105648]|uniref:acyltransferase family protein n=1 Tax=Actinokineospora sp. NBRC 105648 TaxID=3032206 RepID=UPI0024A388AB|nr:acyltransferase [Actinokineospora sp. NBRC 105648]GLZ41625.1 acyltransferase [Actinokineospora sp. NBRC 105648]